MKTLNKIKVISLSLLLAGAVLTGCKKDSTTTSDVSGAGSSQGYKPIRTLRGPSLTIKLINTSPMADTYKELNVDIRRIDVLYEKTDPIGWYTISETQLPHVIDLMHLENTLLLNKTKLFIGKIEKIRLFFGPQNSIVALKDGNRVRYEVKIPDKYQSGVEVTVNTAMATNTSNTMVLDFEANASVSNEGNGEYILDPVIKTQKNFDPPTGPVPVE
ncbi:MAG: DUF4382 domain-containing protein [Bacteroidia bacterium]